MATLPKATTTAEETAGTPGGGSDLICILAASATNADAMPRLFGSADSAYAMHGYSRGIEYSSLHTENTGKPFIFVALPIAVAGVIGRVNKAGHTGSSSLTLTAGGAGTLGEHDGIVNVVKGGTIGTDQIVLEYSLDGGVSFKTYRLGTAASMTFPYVNVSLAFGAGTLVTGDTLVTWHGSTPLPDATGLQSAFDNLAAQAKQFRSVMLIGDMPSHVEAQAFLDLLNSYETAHERFVYGRASVADRLPLAAISTDKATMSGPPSLTFAEVGATGDTVTRATGSWLTDGFAVGDFVAFTGTVSNNVTGLIASLSATVLTFGTTDLAAEVIATASCVGYAGLVFDSTAHTVTRSRGSWIADGFRVGDSVTFAGTASNNVTKTITALTATVMTFASGLVAETVSSQSVTCTTGQTKAAWMAATEAEFATIDGPTAKRIDLGAGRGKKLSPFSGWNFRFPVTFAASIREYQHSEHIPVWRKMDGNTGFDLFDDEGNLVEWDDRVDGAAGSAARFTTFRTWGNGPAGAFITLSLTRDSDGSILGLTHNLAVTNIACTVIQSVTENFIGRTPVLNDDGTMADFERSALEAEVNAALELALLSNKGEGQKASNALWTASSDDVLNVPDALLTGVCTLNLRGTIHSVDTRVRVRSGGQ